MLLCPAECLACMLDITDCMQNVTTDLLLTHLSLLKETDLAMTEYLEERITRRAGRSCLTAMRRMRWRVWEMEDVARIHTACLSLTLTVLRLVSSGVAGRREKTSRQSSCWQGNLLMLAGQRRRTVR